MFQEQTVSNWPLYTRPSRPAALEIQSTLHQVSILFNKTKVPFYRIGIVHFAKKQSYLLKKLFFTANISEDNLKTLKIAINYDLIPRRFFELPKCFELGLAKIEIQNSENSPECERSILIALLIKAALKPN